MIRNPRILWSVAACVSLALHAAVGFEIMDLPIGSTQRSLFDQTEPPRPPFQVIRSGDDIIVDDTRPSDSTDGATTPDDGDRDMADLLAPAMDQLEKPLASLPAPPDPAADPSAAPAPELSPTPLDEGMIVPGRDADTSARLLALADPVVKPPVFVSPTDGIDVAPPQYDVDPKAAVALSELRVMGSTFKAGPILVGPPGLPQRAAAGDGGTATGNGEGAPVIPPAAEVVEPTVIIELPETLIAPEPADDEPVRLDDDFTYELFVYDPPGNEPGYFEVRITPRRTLRRLQTLDRDVIFVIDTSESIGVTWIKPIKAGVSEALTTLNGGDRFNLSMFKDTVSVLSPTGLVPVDDTGLAEARAFLQSAEPSGYTDVNRAIARMLSGTTGSDRVSQIVLISDGTPTRGAIDPRRIINLITRENDLVAGIFCVGVGDDINRELLDFLAYRNKGFVVYATDWLQAATTIRDTLGRLRYPVMKDVALRSAGVDASAIYPRIGRDLYQGEVFRLFGRRDGAERLTMTLTGASGDEVMDFSFTLPFDRAERADKSLARDWAFWKLHHLYSEMLRSGESRAVKVQIEQLQRKYGLKTVY